MNNRRKLIVAFGTGALAAPLRSFAQQPGKIPRLGYISAQSRASEDARREGFRLGLRELGYIEGKNIVVDYIYADGDIARLPAIAADLVRQKVDMIIATGNVVVPVAQQATRTIPIVFPLHGDPVGSGVVASLARPGGNVTGLTSLAYEISSKRLEIIKDTVPRLARVAVVSNSNNPDHANYVKEMKAAAAKLGVQAQFLTVNGSDDFERVFSTIAKSGVQAFIFFADEFFNLHRERIAAFAVKNRLPMISHTREWTEAGGLMSYGIDVPDQFRRAATYVDKILKGAKPGDLPVQQPTRFELVINLKTAKQIGLKIPPSVLARADRVIE